MGTSALTVLLTASVNGFVPKKFRLKFFTDPTYIVDCSYWSFSPPKCAGLDGYEDIIRSIDNTHVLGYR